MAKAPTGLQPKHFKALELFEEGVLSIKDIANACGIPEASMYDLCEGNSNKVGQTAHLFKNELDKITARTAARVKYLSNDNKKHAHSLLNTRLKELRTKKKLTKVESGEVTKILQAINKSTPNVEIGSMSFTKGMTGEELRNEFSRLTALAEQAVKSGGIRSIGQEEPGGISGTAPSRNRLPQE